MKIKESISSILFAIRMTKIIIVLLSLTMLFFANYGLIFNKVKLVIISSAIIIINYLILYAVKRIQITKLSSHS